MQILEKNIEGFLNFINKMFVEDIKIQTRRHKIICA